MIIKDHINLTGDNALRGIIDPVIGFPFISIFYDVELQDIAQEAAKQVPGFSEGLKVHRKFITKHQPSRVEVELILMEKELIWNRLDIDWDYIFFH